MTAIGKNRITIYGPKTDGTYLVEFRKVDGEALAISIPRGETAVLKYFQERMPYGLFVARRCALIFPRLCHSKINHPIVMTAPTTVLRYSEARIPAFRFITRLTKEVPMRKSWVFIIALATLGFVAAGEASAGRVSIGGTHSADEIKGTCDSVGGIFSSGGGRYGCVNECGAGGNDTCSVSCVNGKCTGSCPSCGRRDPQVLPVLGGADAALRSLKDTAGKSSRPYR